MRTAIDRTNDQETHQLTAFRRLLLALNVVVAFSPPQSTRLRKGGAPVLQNRRSTPRLQAQPDVWDDWYGYQCAAEPPSDDDELMNYGLYTDPLHPAAVDHPQAHMANMYCQLVVGTNITGLRVLEVGSGRGGGARILHKYHQPAVYVGLDLCSPQVQTSNQRLATLGSSSLVFVQGDACDLPFPDNSFDVVVNVESSHNYVPFKQFLEEVKRVLVSNGKFLIEDFRANERELDHMQHEIEEVFGTDIDITDISANIQKSLEINKEYIEYRIRKCEEFASRQDCEGYWLYSGRWPTKFFKVQLHDKSQANM